MCAGTFGVRERGVRLRRKNRLPYLQHSSQFLAVHGETGLVSHFWLLSVSVGRTCFLRTVLQLALEADSAAPKCNLSCRGLDLLPLSVPAAFLLLAVLLWRTAPVSCGMGQKAGVFQQCRKREGLSLAAEKAKAANLMNPPGHLRSNARSFQEGLVGGWRTPADQGEPRCPRMSWRRGCRQTAESASWTCAWGWPRRLCSWSVLKSPVVQKRTFSLNSPSGGRVGALSR